MRTTLVLNDGVYETARRRAFEQRRSLGAVISELAEIGLDAEQNGRGKHCGVRFGAYGGQIWMADDFDDVPQDWLDAIQEPIDPTDR